MDSNSRIFRDMMEAGIKLEARCTTTSLAILYWQEFCSKVPTNVKICQYTLAAACFHSAGKTEEDLLKIRDIINVFHSILNADQPIMDIDERYWELREGIGKLEMLILRVLKFHMWRELPHKFFLYYTKTLQNWVNRDEWSKSPVARLGWTILNDSFMKPGLIMKYRPESIALAVLYLTFNAFKITVPLTEDTGVWWTIFHKGTTLHDIQEICINLFDMYNKID